MVKNELTLFMIAGVSPGYIQQQTDAHMKFFQAYNENVCVHHMSTHLHVEGFERTVPIHVSIGYIKMKEENASGSTAD